MVKYKLDGLTEDANIYSSGVYMIENVPTGIKYIGSTKNTFSCRWRAHIAGFYKNIGNPNLVKLFNQYGLESFKFKIIEELPSNDVSYMRNRERYWIEFYDTVHNGANCTFETENIFSDQSIINKHKYTEEEKYIKMLESPTKKRVYLYDIKGNLLQIFPSTVACDRFLGLQKRRTNWIVNHPGRALLGQKYFPSYEEKDWIPEEIIKQRRTNIAKKVAESRKKNGTYRVSDNQKALIRLHNKKSMKISLFTKDGELVKTFNSLNECDDYLCMTRGSTSKVLKGKAKMLKRKYIPKLI